VLACAVVYSLSRQTERKATNSERLTGFQLSRRPTGWRLGYVSRSCLFCWLNFGLLFILVKLALIWSFLELVIRKEYLVYKQLFLNSELWVHSFSHLSCRPFISSFVKVEGTLAFGAEVVGVLLNPLL
jgi:hypothetical protein